MPFDLSTAVPVGFNRKTAYPVSGDIMSPQERARYKEALSEQDINSAEDSLNPTSIKEQTISKPTASTTTQLKGLAGILQKQHPEWTVEQIAKEVEYRNSQKRM